VVLAFVCSLRGQRMLFSQCHGHHSPATRSPQPQLAEVARIAKARHEVGASSKECLCVVLSTESGLQYAQLASQLCVQHDEA
jgi:hypothetical protein